MAGPNKSRLLDLRSQLLISDLSNAEQETYSQAKSANKQLRIMFDMDKNCLYCGLCNGLNVENNFPLPFYTLPSEAVTDVKVFGFDFIKPGTLFAIILAKRQQRNDTAFFMSIDLAKKLHNVWESKSAGKFNNFVVTLRNEENCLVIFAESESLTDSNNYIRSTVKICFEQPNRPLQHLATVFGRFVIEKASGTPTI